MKFNELLGTVDLTDTEVVLCDKNGATLFYEIKKDNDYPVERIEARDYEIKAYLDDEGFRQYVDHQGRELNRRER